MRSTLRTLQRIVVTLGLTHLTVTAASVIYHTTGTKEMKQITQPLPDQQVSTDSIKAKNLRRQRVYAHQLTKLLNGRGDTSLIASFFSSSAKEPQESSFKASSAIYTPLFILTFPPVQRMNASSSSSSPDMEDNGRDRELYESKMAKIEKDVKRLKWFYSWLQEREGGGRASTFIDKKVVFYDDSTKEGEGEGNCCMEISVKSQTSRFPLNYVDNGLLKMVVKVDIGQDGRIKCFKHKGVAEGVWKLAYPFLWVSFSLL